MKQTLIESQNMVYATPTKQNTSYFSPSKKMFESLYSFKSKKTSEKKYAQKRL